MSEKREVVVTGLGVFSSIGNTRTDFWNALVSGASGIKPIQAFDASGHKSQMASEVTSFEPQDYLSRHQIRRMARVSQLASCAAVEAVKDAGLNLENEDSLRIGCVIGSAAGDHNDAEELYAKFKEKGPGFVNPLTVPRMIPNMPACNAAMVLGIHGPNLGVSTACATGASAVGTATSLLREGRADVVLAGGAESTITPLVVDSYASMRVLSKRNHDPQGASRPFDADRDGFVIGEGAGVLVLETLEHARQRDAKPLAFLKGYGMTSDAFNVALPEPSGRWAAAAIEDALRDADLSHADIDYINAHGTSTKVNDATETVAIRRVFGHRDVPVSSNKSMIGHTLGAAGALEAAATVLSVFHQVAPPTINYFTKDPDCDLDVVPNESRSLKIHAAISNSFGFGGQNAVLIFTRY